MSKTLVGEMLVGRVDFGESSQARSASYSAEDAMARSIVRLECEAEELRAEVALLRGQARILAEERDEARVQFRSVEALGMALAKTINQMKEERADLRATIESLRDYACRESCRDKAAADGGWANI